MRHVRTAAALVFCLLLPAIALARSGGDGFLDGTISGQLTDSGTGLPVQGWIYAHNGSQTFYAFTDASGNYQVNVPPGTYRVVSFSSVGYLQQLYQGVNCVSCDIVNGGTPVVVGDGDTVSGINFALDRGGKISGVVMNDVDSAPIGDGYVEIYDAAYHWVASGYINADGSYETYQGLPSGIYYARTQHTTSTYIDETYGGDAYCHLDCDVVLNSSPIVVTAPNETTGIDFLLDAGGRFTGRIVDPPSTGRSISDDFDGDDLLTRWMVRSRDNASIFESSGVLQLDTYGGLGEASASSTCVAHGDFDVSVDYTLLNWPDQNDTRLSLTAADLEFLSFAPTGVHRFFFGDDAYRFNANGGEVAAAQTSDAGGRLRLRRVGTTLEAYYWDGSVWVLIGSDTVSTRDTGFELALKNASNGFTFHWASVQLDNFQATVGELSCAVSDAAVQVYDRDGNTRQIYTDFDGRFVSQGLPTGSYWATTYNSGFFVDEAYDNVECVSCWPPDFTPIPVSTFIDTANVDFQLDLGGKVAGRVLDEQTGFGAAGAWVSVYRSDGTYITGSPYVDGAGNYTTYRAVPPGTYYAVADNLAGYVPKLFDDLPCNACDPTTGTPISVVAGESTTTDFALRPVGEVTGNVSSAAGVDLQGVVVRLYDASGTERVSTTTNSDGNYLFFHIAPGSYYVKATNATGFIDQLYSGIDCLLCVVTSGTPVSVTRGGTTENVNFVMSPGGRISGMVWDASGSAIQGVTVTVFNSSGAAVASGLTNSDGNYTSNAFPNGVYYAVTSAPAPYVNEAFNDITCPDCSALLGTPIAVSGLTSDINFSLATGGRLSGRVTNAGGGAALTGLQVKVFTAGNVRISTSVTDAAGNYISPSLPPGPYYAATENTAGFIDEAYDNRICLEDCDPTSADPVTIVASGVAANIDFALAAGGRLAGRVINQNTAAALSNVTLNVFNVTGSLVASAVSDASGDYTLQTGLPTGVYFVKTFNTARYVDELYADVPCLNCSVVSGIGVGLTAGAVTPNINFALVPGGTISGRVYDLSTSNSLANVSVRIYDESGNFIESRTTDAGGLFATQTGLPSGNYYIRSQNTFGYQDRIYNGLPCLGQCTVTSGTAINVTLGNTSANRNLGLPPGGRISGSVTDAANGVPLANVSIEIYSALGVLVGTVLTDASGNYLTLSGLPSGSYYAKTRNSAGYIEKAYNDIQCLDCAATSGTAINVVAPNTSVNINFALNLGGRVSGHITDSTNGLPIANAVVSVLDAAGIVRATVSTDDNGDYLTSGLPPANYYVKTFDTLGYIEEVYNDVVCLNCNAVAVGTAVPVVVGAISNNRNFVLVPGGRISGTVVNGKIGGGLAGVQVQVYDSAGTLVTSRTTDAAGTYVSPALPGGNYYVRTVNSAGFSDQLYSAQPCGIANVLSGTAIPIAAGDNRGINFKLLSPALSLQRDGRHLTITVTGGRCNAGDRIGLSRAIDPENAAPIQWRYLNDTQVAPAAPAAGGVVNFDVTDGIFEFRYLQAGTNAVLGKSAPIFVSSTLPTLTVDKNFVLPGGQVTVTVVGGPGFVGDWLGLYRNGVPNSQWTQWLQFKYLNGQSTPPATGLTTAVVTFTLPTGGGEYYIKMFKNDTSEFNGTTALITVPATPPSITLDALTVAGGTVVRATIANGPGFAGDWLGLYSPTSSAASFLGYLYLNGSLSRPLQGNMNTTVDVVMPFTPGQYNLRLLANDTLTVVATSPTITVTGALPIVTVDSTTVQVGGTINVTITNGPGTVSDWLGTFSAGASSYHDYWYLSGTKTKPATAVRNTTIAVTAPETTGQINVRLFANDSARLMAISPTITVTGLTPSLTIGSSTIEAGATFTTALSGGPGKQGDWLGMFLTTETNNTLYRAWSYLNSSHTRPGSAPRAATVMMTAPPQAGVYNLRLFQNDTLNLVGTSSNTITVVSGPTIGLSTTSAATGATVNATVSNGSGRVGDWIALYPVGAPNSGYVSWKYLNGAQSHPGSGLTNATVPFAMPATPGTYVVRYFYDDSYALRGTSAPITVTAVPASVGLSTTSASVNGTVTVTIANGPGNRADWVGVFPIGAANTGYVRWLYLNGLQSLPASGISNTSFSMQMPSAPGTYEVRLLLNGGTSVVLATSPQITISP